MQEQASTGSCYRRPSSEERLTTEQLKKIKVIFRPRECMS